MDGYTTLEVPDRCAPRITWLKAIAGTAGLTLASVAFTGLVSPLQTRYEGATSLKAVFADGLGGPGAPLAKRVVAGMDNNVKKHIAWNDWKPWRKEMEPWWAEDFIYDFCYVGDWGFKRTQGLRAWYEGEHLHYNAAVPDCQFVDFIGAYTEQTGTSASYGLARWTGAWAGVPPPASKPLVRIRDLDFYQMRGDKISQSSLFTKEDAAESERVWRAALHDDYDSNSSTGQWWADEVIWYGPGGVGGARSRHEYVEGFLKPLRSGFSQFERKTDMVVCEGPYCGAHFYLWGTHTGEWLGEKATGKRIPIRIGAHAHIVNGKIVEGWLIMDIPRAFAAMGVDLYARAREIALASPLL